MECDICGEPIEKGAAAFVYPANDDGPRTVVHQECPNPPPPVATIKALQIEDIFRGGK